MKYEELLDDFAAVNETFITVEKKYRSTLKRYKKVVQDAYRTKDPKDAEKVDRMRPQFRAVREELKEADYVNMMYFSAAFAAAQLDEEFDQALSAIEDYGTWVHDPIEEASWKAEVDEENDAS
jgi:Pyruvate/2-oxoacid:ferredoxin oxidoreductase gamma subunit